MNAKAKFALSNAESALKRALQQVEMLRSPEIEQAQNAEHKQIAIDAAIGYAQQAVECLQDYSKWSA